jgi:hypothetical protein
MAQGVVNEQLAVEVVDTVLDDLPLHAAVLETHGIPVCRPVLQGDGPVAGHVEFDEGESEAVLLNFLYALSLNYLRVDEHLIILRLLEGRVRVSLHLRVLLDQPVDHEVPIIAFNLVGSQVGHTVVRSRVLHLGDLGEELPVTDQSRRRNLEG